MRDQLARQFPNSQVVEVSARKDLGLVQWFDTIASGDLGTGPSMEVDYELYAEGEALLGWLNCTITVSGPDSIDGNQLVRQIADRIQQSLKDAPAEIAHISHSAPPNKATTLPF